MTNTLRKLIECVEAAPIKDPPHIHLENPFPEEYYQSLVDNLPNDDCYGEFFHPDSTYEGIASRLRLILTELPDHMPVHQKEFWTAQLKTFQSHELQVALAKKFAITLEDRFPDNKWNEIPFELQAYLFRDISKYKILPHADTGKKVLTFQAYLPNNNDNRNIGTCFLKMLKNGEFAKVDQIPFIRNYGYVFPVTNESWHSVDEIQEGVVRNSLMLVYSLPKRVEIKDNKIRASKKTNSDY